LELLEAHRDELPVARLLRRLAEHPHDRIRVFVAEELMGTGKYIETWHRGDDGQWLISNDIFNNDPSPKPKMAMEHVMITHSVNDAELWSAAWTGEDSRKGMFKANGAAHVHAFRSADNPNLTGLVIAASDMDALNAMLTSEEGQAAAVEDGVRPDTLVMMTEVK
jgi:hypothetical protein